MNPMNTDVSIRTLLILSVVNLILTCIVLYVVTFILQRL
jgi:hypothetical protein